MQQSVQCSGFFFEYIQYSLYKVYTTTSTKYLRHTLPSEGRTTVVYAPAQGSISWMQVVLRSIVA